MFTVEIKINGALISHIHGLKISAGGEEVAKYKYEFYDVPHSELVKGKVFHARMAGLTDLVGVIIKEAQPKIQKKINKKIKKKVNKRQYSTGRKEELDGRL